MRPIPNHDDEETLICQLQAGNEKAFEVLYNRYWEKLLTIAYHRVGSLEVAKELLQDVFADLWKRRENLEIRNSFMAYMSTAMRYAVLDYIRASKVREKYVELIRNFATNEDYSTLHTIANREILQVLETEVEKLPNKCQEIFKLSRNENFTNKEIAQALNISPKTVENQITKALKLIKMGMKEFTLFLIVLLFS